MRKRVTANGVTVQVVAGNHAVFLGLDLDEGHRSGCLGFAVHREDRTENEAHWLCGFKTFRSVVPAPDPKVQYPSVDHPVQSFWWGDYSAKPAHDYTYRVVPRYGTPAALTDRPGVEAAVDVSTGDPTRGTHGVYFNRGVAASQAYAVRFGASPAKLPPDKAAEAMAWLSRGLHEALTGFIARASSGGTALRAAAFEFTEPGVLAAFQAAHDQGADVRVVYHDKTDETGAANLAAISDHRVADPILVPRRHPKLAHNKFIVLCTRAADGALSPVSVWTGSTNMSEGGIFGHSNVGHEVRDPEVAGRYLAYWERLAGDPTEGPLQTWVAANSPFDADALARPGVHTLFSPRVRDEPLAWYAGQLGGAKGTGHLTLPFGMGADFEAALAGSSGDAVHFVLLESKDDNQAVWSAGRNILVAVGAVGGPDLLSRWAREALTNFNVHVKYVHTKILLVDPLSDDPTVITGSANFSESSTTGNDENMLVIRGDREVADVYFTEMARMFQHFYARWWASQLAGGAHDGDTGFLVENDTWQEPYFAATGVKAAQRLLFGSGVGGNLPAPVTLKGRSARARHGRPGPSIP